MTDKRKSRKKEGGKGREGGRTEGDNSVTLGGGGCHLSGRSEVANPSQRPLKHPVW